MSDRHDLDPSSAPAWLDSMMGLCNASRRRTDDQSFNGWVLRR